MCVCVCVCVCLRQWLQELNYYLNLSQQSPMHMQGKSEGSLFWQNNSKVVSMHLLDMKNILHINKLTSLFISSPFSIWKPLSSRRSGTISKSFCISWLSARPVCTKTTFHAEIHFDMCRLTITWQYFQVISIFYSNGQVS